MILANFLAGDDKSDLQNLIDHQVREGKVIEYKRDLYGNTDSEKKEFLADVSSFANTVGGDLIIGMDEEEALPIEIGANPAIGSFTSVRN